jgi:hypothetical protein
MTVRFCATGLLQAEVSMEVGSNDHANYAKLADP